MKAAYDVGINFFDCAEGYAGGESERVMGQAIKKFGWKRNDLVISTKVSLTPPLYILSTQTDNVQHRYTGAKLTVKYPLTTSVSLANIS